jgi:serine/threonine protein phosphatase PrpC
LDATSKQVLVAEETRIIEAGGHVKANRVNGQYHPRRFLKGINSLIRYTGRLALSRALGDFAYKKNKMLPPEKQIITADPDVLVHDLSHEDEFLVLASDGSSSSLFLQLRHPLILFAQGSGTVCPRKPLSTSSD